MTSDTTDPKDVPSMEGSFETESYYAKKADGYVYYYWRVVGLDEWTVHKTSMKEVPYVEQTDPTSELREKLILYRFKHEPLTRGLSREDVEAIMQLISDQTNKAVSDTIDRIQESLNSHTTPQGQDLLTRSYIDNTLDFERGRLQQTGTGEEKV